MKKLYLNNIRWITVCLVVIYHCFYMYNGVIKDGIAGPFTSGIQYQDAIQYILYPWFMTLLFVISGMCARYELNKKDPKEFLRKRTAVLSFERNFLLLLKISEELFPLFHFRLLPS